MDLYEHRLSLFTRGLADDIDARLCGRADDLE
jgi:hypothetical protein